MPRRRPEDVVEVLMTDHRIQRAPDREAYALELAPALPDPVLSARPYFEDRAPRGGLGRVYAEVAAARSGDPAAIDRLRASLDEAQPQELEPWVDLAHALNEAGRSAEAVEVLSGRLERGDDRAVARLWLGVALSALGRDTQALGHLDRALELEPDSVDALFARASVLVRLGRDREALEVLARVVALRPNHSLAHLTVGLAHLRAQALGPAAEALERALAVEPRRADAHLALSQVLTAQGRQAESLERLRLGARNAPDDARIADALALGHLLGPDPALLDPAAALRHARRGAALKPEAPLHALTLVLALVRAELWVEALDECERAQRIGADEATCLALRAFVLMQQGAASEARASWERARSLASRPATSAVARDMAFRLAQAALR
jgi:tetratricopeptide (TPR) repeat protein